MGTISEMISKKNYYLMKDKIMDYKFREINVLKIVSWVFIRLVMATITAFLFGFFVLMLWNWLMPDLFGIGKITYIQAWGLVLLSHILFKSGHSGSDQHDYKFHRRFARKGSGSVSNHSHKHEKIKDDWKRDFFSKMQENDIKAQEEEEKEE